MKLKLDENLGKRGYDLLIAAGHDVSTVAIQGMQSAPDRILIEVCRQEGRALVTLDLDFANPLDFLPSLYPGIAVIRLPKKPAAEDLSQAIETFAKGLVQNPLTGRLWIVEKGRIRLYQQDDEH